MSRSGRTWLDRLGGLAVSEERRLAGRMAGALYLVGAGTALTLLALPDVPRSHWYVIVACSLIGLAWGTACLTVIDRLAWGTACLTVIDWQRASAPLSHL